MNLLRYLPYLECFWNKNKLFEVTYFVTNKCNFKCPFCFNDSTAKDMTLVEIEETAKKLGKFCRLLLSGGEPFLRNDLAEICRIFVEHCDVQHITIPTNGYFYQKIRDFIDDFYTSCPKVTINISLSIDCIGKERDLLVGVVGSFSELLFSINSLQMLQKEYKNLLVGTITTQCPQNETKLFKIYKEISKYNLDYFSFNRARGTDYNKNIYRRFSNFLMKKHRDRVGVPFFSLKKKLVFDAVLNEQSIPCYSGTLRKVIGADGTIYPCETIMFGGKCPCWHECDLAINLIFNWRSYVGQK